MDNRYSYYSMLLSNIVTYKETLEMIKRNHRRVEEDYFMNEDIYNAVLRGESDARSLTQGGDREEGCWIHHDLENQYSNMSKLTNVVAQQVPYEGQKKENLTFVDPIEHIILHTKINHETNGKLGTHGLITHLLPNFKSIMINGKTPARNNVDYYSNIILSKEESEKILGLIRLKGKPYKEITLTGHDYLPEVDFEDENYYEQLLNLSYIELADTIVTKKLEFYNIPDFDDGSMTSKSNQILGLHVQSLQELNYDELGEKQIKEPFVDIPVEAFSDKQAFYVDDVEHVITHAVIARETDGLIGTRMLGDQIGVLQKWYIDKQIPKNQKKIAQIDFVNKHHANTNFGQLSSRIKEIHKKLK